MKASNQYNIVITTIDGSLTEQCYINGFILKHEMQGLIVGLVSGKEEDSVENEWLKM